MLTGRARIAYVVSAVSIAGGLAAAVKRGKTAKLDARATHFVQAKRDPRFSRLMNTVSWAGFPPQSRTLPLAIPAAIALSGDRFDAVFQLAAWGTSAVSGTVKQIMRRPRPTADLFNVVPARIGGTSFPSGHVINYTGVYGFLAFLAHRKIRFAPLRKLVVGALGSLIALVGLSRIYLGHHWLTDVITSYLLGSSYLVFLTWIYDKSSARAWAVTSGRIDIVGHSGAGDFFPGNSRSSVLKAIEIGVDRIEIDVLPTASGELVLIHDDELPDGAGRLTKTRLLSTAEVRSRVDELLTLAEFFDLVGADMPVLLDLKRRGYEAAVIEALRGQTARDVWISTSQAVSIVRLKRALPNVTFGLSSGHFATAWQRTPLHPPLVKTVRWVMPVPLIVAAKFCGARKIMVNFRACGPELLTMAHALSLGVDVWTVNRPADIARMIDLGVDAITSNRPDLVREQLKR